MFYATLMATVILAISAPDDTFFLALILLPPHKSIIFILFFQLYF